MFKMRSLTVAPAYPACLYSKAHPWRIMWAIDMVGEDGVAEDYWTADEQRPTKAEAVARATEIGASWGVTPKVF